MKRHKKRQDGRDRANRERSVSTDRSPEGRSAQSNSTDRSVQTKPSVKTPVSAHSSSHEGDASGPQTAKLHRRKPAHGSPGVGTHQNQPGSRSTVLAQGMPIPPSERPGYTPQTGDNDQEPKQDQETGDGDDDERTPAPTWRWELIDDPITWQETISEDDLCFNRFYFFPTDVCSEIELDGEITPKALTYPSEYDSDAVLELLARMDVTFKMPRPGGGPLLSWMNFTARGHGPLPQDITDTLNEPVVESDFGQFENYEDLDDWKYETIRRQAHEKRAWGINETGSIEAEATDTSRGEDSGGMLTATAEIAEAETRDQILSSVARIGFDLSVEQSKATVGALPIHEIPIIGALVAAFTITGDVGQADVQSHNVRARTVRNDGD